MQSICLVIEVVCDSVYDKKMKISRDNNLFYYISAVITTLFYIVPVSTSSINSFPRTGSNSVSRLSRIILTASSASIALLYGRGKVMASYVSARARILLPRGIALSASQTATNLMMTYDWPGNVSQSTETSDYF